jgi:hypothetical protein
MTSQAQQWREKKARWRRRQRAGDIVLGIEVCEDDLAWYLMKTERLSPEAALRRRELERATTELIRQTIARMRAALHKQ